MPPSGDQVGQVSWAIAVLVIRVWPLPSAFTTQMSQLPNSLPRHLVNATCDPAAFQSGRPSRAPGVSVRRAVLESAADLTQMSPLRPNAMSPLPPGNVALAAGPPARNRVTKVTTILVRLMAAHRPYARVLC